MSEARKKSSRIDGDVPGAGDPDRKRVLNVLAQRRYRQRRREKMAALEAQAKNQNGPQFTESPEDAPGLAATWTDSASANTPIQTSVNQNSSSFVAPMFEFGGEQLDQQLVEDFNLQFSDIIDFSPAASPSSSVTPYSSTITNNNSFTSTPAPTFPIGADGAQLAVPCLEATRAALSIVETMGLSDVIWNPNHMHIFPSWIPLHKLPPNLHPTPAQLAIPHHPFFDVLPWPSIRQKLLLMMAMPSGFRPPVARDHDPKSMGQTEAVQRLIADLDDMSNGIRVHGNLVGWGESNEMVEEAWEIGESFFQNWWWCIGDDVLRVTNRRRRERGLGPLRIKG